MTLLRPLLLHYFITFRCNCRCSFCDIWNADRYDQTIFADIKDVEQNLIEAKKLGVKFVDFTGGEPLLHPHIRTFLKLARKLGYRTSVTTNCLLYPQIAESIKGQVDFLHFSLDSLIESQHDEIRNKKAFVSVLTSIDTARALGEKPDLLFTVTDINVKQTGPLSELAKRLGLLLLVNPVFTNSRGLEISLQNLKFLERFQYKPYVYINKAFHRLRGNGGNSIQKPRCRAVDSTLVISPDNHLLLPCFHFCQIKKAINGDLSGIYNSEKLREYKNRQGRFDFCERCMLNCYFDPSFVYKCDVYFLESLFAKARYVYYKHIRRMADSLFGRLENRPALQIVKEINSKYFPENS
ncbi:radical SAM protein [candidate division KSB1 bacterium]|nr:radical SAM protein [candidate division KSB1 bacterium]